jgi:hypothetical protein
MTDAQLEEIGDVEVRLRFERGDYLDPAELKTVKKWLQTNVKEREHLAACKRASISSALDATRSARRANVIAILALVISAAAAHDQIDTIVKAIFYSVKP